MIRKRNHGCRITTGLTIAGYEALVLENRALRVTLLPGKGSDIVELLYKPSDTELLWTSPIGLWDAHSYHPTISSSTGLFLDHYEGGWQELFPSAGSTSRYRKAEFGLHGEVALLPWRASTLVDKPEEVTVQLDVRCVRTPFEITKILQLRHDEPTICVRETVRNLSREDVAVQWGHHPAFGAPFITAGTRFKLKGNPRIIVPVEQDEHDVTRLQPGSEGQWPFLQGKQGEQIDLSVMPSAEAGVADYVMIPHLDEPWFRIESDPQGLGVEMLWDGNVMPHLWYWLVAGGSGGFPMWSSTYSVALEPINSLCAAGLGQAVEARQVTIVPAMGQCQFHLELRVFTLSTGDK